MKKILIAPNSFKECANSVEIAELIKFNICKLKRLESVTFPLSDGGDGFREYCKYLFDTKSLTYYLKDSYDFNLKEIIVEYIEKARTIYIESADLIGLKMIAVHKRNPLKLNSKPLGELLKILDDKNRSGEIEIDSIIIGIGGTATIDFGIGACSIFDLNLFDDSGEFLEPNPENFDRIRNMSWSGFKPSFNLSFILDVDTPLIGNPGSIEMYGKQKGADSKIQSKIKSGIINLFNHLPEGFKDIDFNKLNGAGGGIASGILLFLGASLIPSKDFLANNICNKFDIDSFNAVVTGEGNLDPQTFEGKSVYQVLELFSKKSIPIFIVCGQIDHSVIKRLPANAIPIQLMDFYTSKEESIKNYKKGIELASKQILKYLSN